MLRVGKDFGDRPVERVAAETGRCHAQDLRGCNQVGLFLVRDPRRNLDWPVNLPLPEGEGISVALEHDL